MYDAARVNLHLEFEPFHLEFALTELLNPWIKL